VRLFVHFDRRGTIISVSKVEFMNPDLVHPHAGLTEGDEVIELDPEEEHLPLDAHEIAEHYTVDMKTRKLRKRRK
jgi:hypothetical protein